MPLTPICRSVASLLAEVALIGPLPLAGWSIEHERLDELEGGSPSSMHLALHIGQPRPLHPKPSVYATSSIQLALLSGKASSFSTKPLSMWAAIGDYARMACRPSLLHPPTWHVPLLVPCVSQRAQLSSTTCQLPCAVHHSQGA